MLFYFLYNYFQWNSAVSQCALEIDKFGVALLVLTKSPSKYFLVPFNERGPLFILLIRKKTLILWILACTSFRFYSSLLLSRVVIFMF